MTTLISFAALFVAILLVQLGSGSLAPLDALGGARLGYSTAQIGLMGSCHFLGFFVGCWVAPRVIGRVGYARAFAATAAFGAIGALLHPVLEGPYAWAGLRLLSGFAIAGAYTVIESWMQASVQNHNRGRVFGGFRMSDLLGQILAQGLIAVLEPGSYVAYNIVAVFCCLCVLPITLTRAVAPVVGAAPRLQPLRAARMAPAACAGVVTAGMTGAAFRMVGPVFGAMNGLGTGQMALFLGASVIGGAVAQYPVGWVSDMVDRRRVLVGLSLSAIVACLGTAALVGPGDIGGMYLAAFLFGATALPLYSVAAAYANDQAPRDFTVELNAALLFYFSVGAVVSPLLVAGLIERHGPVALFLFIAAAHALLVGFAVYRMSRRAAAGPSGRLGADLPIPTAPGGAQTVPAPAGAQTVVMPGGAQTVTPPGGAQTVPAPQGVQNQGVER